MLALAGGIVPVAGSDIVIVSGKRDGKAFRKEIDFPKCSRLRARWKTFL